MSKIQIHNKTIKNTEEKFEDWHKPIYTEDPDHVPKTFMKPPQRYENNFLAKLDKRTESFQILNDAYQEISSDLGGLETLSHIQKVMVERFCFLEFFLKVLELRIATRPKNSSKLISRWVQGCNSLMGIAKCVGLERRVKTVKNLKDYVLSKKAKSQ